MKKKIILSIVALFMLCFSMIGFVGCDSRSNSPKLVVYSTARVDGEEAEKEISLDSDISVARIRKVNGFDFNGDGTEVAILDNAVNDDQNGDKVLTDADMVHYKSIHCKMRIEYHEFDKTTKNYTIKETWNTLREFINGGGIVSDFKLDKVGTFKMRISYNGTEMILNYEIVES